MRKSFWLLAAALLALLAGTSGAGAQSAPQLDIRIERDTRPRTSATALAVYHVVTVTDRATGAPPEKVYLVFGQATNQNGEQTEFEACDHVATVDSRVSRGVYNCALFMDHGGAWDFHAVVKEPQADPTQPQELTAEVGRASAPFELAADLVNSGKAKAVRTSTSAVIALWMHTLVTVLWFVCVIGLGALALPRARRRLSGFGLNRLERRLDDLVKLTWTVTAGVVATGVYLLLNETAYKTPFSSSKMDAVFDLPYGKPYFIALGVKLALYAVMLGATVPLVFEAKRQAHLMSAAARAERSRVETTPSPSPSPEPARGGVATVTAPTATTQTSPRLEPATSRLSQGAVAVMFVGAFGISLAVTLLKYFHQIIEAAAR